jgi:Predicted hydrolases or acyltransferases (alpha/beta hydrolase superfamily)
VRQATTTGFDSLRDLSNDIKLFCDELKLDKFSIVAWSTGGGVAMYFAIDYPAMVEKIALVESVGIKGYPIFKKDENNQPIIGQFLTTKEEIEKDPVQVLPILRAYEDKNKDFIKFVWDNTIYTFKKPEEERYQRYLDEILMQRNLVDIDYSLVHFNISHEHNGAEQGSGEVDKITQPVLVMQGENDLVVPKEMGIEMANAIGENAKLALLPNGGHAPMEDDLDRFMKVLLEFLA